MSIAIDDPRLLRALASPPDSFSEPFVLDGWRYYSNRSIYFRLPAPGEENTTERWGIPEESPRLFRGNRWKIGEFLPWPKVQYSLRRIPCYWCINNLSAPAVLHCPTCGDDREVMIAAFGIVNGRRIRPVYNEWISELPNPEFLNEGGDCDWLAFRFDGGQGIVKPIYSDDLCRADQGIINASSGEEC
jgi:hypothetical protein